MAQSIFDRVSFLLAATVQDMVDRMERAGGDAVMREAIREAERAIEQVKAELESTMARRLQAARHQKMLTERADALTAQAEGALRQGREDLAEAALSRQVDFEAQARELDAVQLEVREAERRLEVALAALGARKREMEDALQAWLASRATAGGPTRTAEKRVDAAERTFDRAMAGADGAGVPRSDAGTIKQLAQLERMQKSAIIAERLAALKASAS